MSSTISVPWQCTLGHHVICTYRLIDLRTAAEFRELKFFCHTCQKSYVVDAAAAAFVSQLLDAIPRPSGGKPPGKLRPLPAPNARNPEILGKRWAFLEAMVSPK